MNPEPPPSTLPGIAQSVERSVRGGEAAGSSPASRTITTTILKDRGDGYADLGDGTLVRIAGIDLSRARFDARIDNGDLIGSVSC